MTLFHSPSHCHKSRVEIVRRPGLVAGSEMMVVLVCLISLFWLATQFWSVVEHDSQQTEHVLRGCSERSVYRIALDQDGQRMWVYRPYEGLLRLNLRTGSTEESRMLPGMDVCALAHSSDGGCSLVCGTDAVLWYGTRQDVLMGPRTARNGMVVDAAVSANGGMAVCVTTDGLVRGWSRHGEEMKEFTYDLPSVPAITRMGISKSGLRMCVARCDNSIAIHNPETGIREAEVLGFASAVHALGWSDDDRSIATVGSDGQVRMYDAVTLSCLWKAPLDVRFGGTFPTTVVVSPNGKWIAVGFSNSNHISVYTLDESDAVRELTGHQGIVRTLQFSPNSQSLFSGSFDGTIREWATTNWCELRVVD
jgi:WD40 repeat protein